MWFTTTCFTCVHRPSIRIRRHCSESPLTLACIRISKDPSSGMDRWEIAVACTEHSYSSLWSIFSHSCHQLQRRTELTLCSLVTADAMCVILTINLPAECFVHWHVQMINCINSQRTCGLLWSCRDGRHIFLIHLDLQQWKEYYTAGPFLGQPEQ